MRKIITFMDFTCPYSYIGFEILLRLKEEHPNIEYKWYPYILNESTPTEGKNIYSNMDPEEKEKIIERIVRLGNEYGIIYNQLGIMLNTNRVHRASLFARDNEKLSEFGRLVFQKLFRDKENIGNKNIIDSVAEEVGLDIDKMNSFIDSGKYEDEIILAKQMAEKYNVTSVPTFIVDDKNIVTTLKEFKEFKKDLENIVVD